MSYITCLVLPGQMARIVALTNPDRLRDLTRTVGPVFLPVCAFEATPTMFTSATSWSLPSVHPLDLAAFIFRRASLPAIFNRPVCNWLDRMGDKAAPLLVDWFKAVEAARDVNQVVNHPRSSPGWSAAFGTANAA